MALSTARMHKVRGRPPLLAAGISSWILAHSSSVRSLGYVCSFIFPFYKTHEDFSDRLLCPKHLSLSRFMVHDASKARRPRADWWTVHWPAVLLARVPGFHQCDCGEIAAP